MVGSYVWNSCLALLACLVVVIIRYGYASRRPQKFPPGPPTLPIIGNLHQLPLKKPFTKFHEWGRSFGPIVGLKFGPQNVVVLNSHAVVAELFDKRGAIYSSRPNNYVGNELLCPGETHILLVPYGNGWRKLRKATQTLLNVTAVDHVLPVQQAESAQAMFQLLQKPKDCYKHIRRYSTAVILASVFGQRGPSYEDSKVRALYHAQEQFTDILAPGATPPVDAFPFLRFIPTFLAPWKARAQAIRYEQRSLYQSLLNETKEKLQGKNRIECFMGKLLEAQAKSGLDEEHIVYTGGILMEAGSDTTSSTLLSFILAMIANPKVLEAAQKELDNICGVSNMPSWQDVKDLPYMLAIMTETLRWRPVAPGGIPHLLIQNDYYNDYFLPKGTIVFANTWSIHQDDSEYDSPQEFVPERFLHDKFGRKQSRASAAGDDNRRVTYSFGAGRRVCPGQRLAENSLIVMMSRMAWAFNITADLDSSSPPHSDVEADYTDGFVFSPKPFTARFTIRSPQHRDAIEREYEKAKEFFARYEE